MPPSHPPGLASTLLVGHPRRGSRTLAVGRRAAELLRDGLADEGLQVAPADLLDLAGDIGSPQPWLLEDRPGGRAGNARQLATRPGLLIVVSPTFKGSYSGLLKLFLDALPVDGLSATVAIPLMTAGWPQHRLVADTHLRALLVELGATVPVRGFAVLETDLSDLDTVLATWAHAAAPVLAAVLQRWHWRSTTETATTGPGAFQEVTI